MSFLKNPIATLFFFVIMASGSAATGQEIGKRANSDILNLDGDPIGTAALIQGSEGVLIEIRINGLTPGKHGMHFHAVGVCDERARFKNAKGHIMPSGRPHGFLHPEGPHEGNLPNLIVNEDGAAHVELYTGLVSIGGRGGKPALLDKDGSTLIIHENVDDHLTQPIGGSGGRVACGVIKPVE